MAECYTNVYSALQTLMRSGQTVASMPAFMAGANGPAPLFMYRVWKRHRRPNLPALAEKMYHEQTGAFLLALARHAVTPIQQSYVLGFITHYSVSCTLNPYLDAMSAKGTPYGMYNGHYILATALDSELYYRDYNSRLIPYKATAPVLITDDLAQVTTLLHECIALVYGKEVPLLALADTFHDNLFMRRMMTSRTGIKKLLVRFMQPRGLARYGGPLLHRMQPGKKLLPLPKNWKNPYTGEEMDLTLNEVLALAQQTGAVCITAAMRYWLGDIAEDMLAGVLGNNDYTTGLPNTARPAGPA